MRVTPDQINSLAGGLARDPAAVRRRIEVMEGVLERAFTVPGTSHKFGLDTVVGFVPVLGDVVTAAMGAWLVWEARNLGMSKWQIARMAGNLGVDTLLGAVPLVGDAFDFFFKSNTRNLRIIKRHLDKHHPATVTVDAQAPSRRASRESPPPQAGEDQAKSRPISAAGADWVKRPTEM